MKPNQYSIFAMALCSLYAGAQPMNSEAALRRVLMFSVRLDPKFKQVKLQSVSEIWCDRNEIIKIEKSIKTLESEAYYDVELLFSSGKTIRSAVGGGPGGVITSRGLESTPDHTLDAAISTEEDAVGLRVYNRKTGELVAEKHFQILNEEPKILLGGDLFQDSPVPSPLESAPPITNEKGDAVVSRNYSPEGLNKPIQVASKHKEPKRAQGPGAYLEIDRSITSVSIKISADNGRTWMHFLEGAASRWPFGKAFPAELRKKGMIFSVNVFIGMKVYRKLFRYEVGTGFKELNEPFVPPHSRQLRMTWEGLGNSQLP